MTAVLLSKHFIGGFGHRLRQAASEAGLTVDPVHLPDDGSPLPQDVCDRIEAAYLSRDLRFSRELYPTFGAAVTAAKKLKWVHFASAGIDQHPFLAGLRARGVRLTTSAGANGEPVGQTAITGLLMLARGFPRWMAAQRRRAWEPVRGQNLPRDIEGQTVIVVGLGTIGMTIARFCQALRMHVIGVRRSVRSPEDPVDEMHAISELPAILRRCDFLVLACPLTPETRGLVNAEKLALMPKGANVINVARGAVVDEPALIEALRSGHIGGASLDVFHKEPLPTESPLWDMPNVIVSPHNAQAATGNEGRAAEIFAGNLVRYARGERMVNEQ